MNKETAKRPELIAYTVTESRGENRYHRIGAAWQNSNDAEFALDPGAGVIQPRSGARLGIRDFGVNRERIEGLRKIMGRP